MRDMALTSRAAPDAHAYSRSGADASPTTKPRSPSEQGGSTSAGGDACGGLMDVFWGCCCLLVARVHTPCATGGGGEANVSVKMASGWRDSGGEGDASAGGAVMARPSPMIPIPRPPRRRKRRPGKAASATSCAATTASEALEGPAGRASAPPDAGIPAKG